MRRPLLLSGFMAVGKTTIGRRVAELTRRPFVDLDARIEETAGRSVRQIFEQEGEPGFRRRERTELERVLDDGKPVVVALGGGALLDRRARLSALARAVVVTLEATADEIARRAAASGARPLLDADSPTARRDEIETLLEARRPSYVEAHARLATDGVDASVVAERVREVWGRDPIVVPAGERSYCVDVARGGGARVGALASGAALALVVTDDHVAPLHAGALERNVATAGLRTVRAVLPAGEENKTPAALEAIWKAAQSAGADRNTVLVALGGGVVTDLAGFAAATWNRGIDWIAVPTTLLAMVDASVGGKTAVDLGSAKNAVGAFWQPRGVVCDVDLEATEPARGFRSALAEVVKTALIGDPALLQLLEERRDEVIARDPDVISEMVRRSVQVKARIVGEDEREGGRRAVLNLGHTIGHALEAHGGYGRLTHGEAVSLGLVAALGIGERLGTTPPGVRARAVAALEAVSLPVDLAAQPLADALELMRHDKKRFGDRVRFVVARGVGDVAVVDLALADVAEHAREL